MSDELNLDEITSLGELEEKLQEAFETSAVRAAGTYSETGAGYANATARLAEALLKVRQQRIAEHDRAAEDGFSQKKPRLGDISRKG